MSDDLVERVAEALFALAYSDVSPAVRAELWATRPLRMTGDRFFDQARVAIAIIEPAVREECAKVADGEARMQAYTTSRQYEDPAFLEKCDAKEEVANDIAAAIRAGAKP